MCVCLCSQFSLQHIVNVEKRPDAAKGSRYLLELELLERSGRRVRLAHYIYGLQYPGQSRGRGVPKQSDKLQLLLCNPHGFQWNPRATVHFIIPGELHTSAHGGNIKVSVSVFNHTSHILSPYCDVSTRLQSKF